MRFFLLALVLACSTTGPAAQDNPTTAPTERETVPDGRRPPPDTREVELAVGSLRTDSIRSDTTQTTLANPAGPGARDSSAEARTLGLTGSQWLRIGVPGAIVLLGLIAGGVWWTRTRGASGGYGPAAHGGRGYTSNVGSAIPPAAPLRGTQAPPFVPGAMAKESDLRARVDALEEIMATLQQRVVRVETYLNQQVAAPQIPAPRPAEPPRALPADEAVAAAFVGFCNTAGGLVSKPDLFERQLREAVPGASLSIIYRDLDSYERPVVFGDDGGKSPAAYWLVRAGSETLLLPQPQGPHQFRDLSPVFDGSAVPQTLARIRPARVGPSEGQFVLVASGQIA